MTRSVIGLYGAKHPKSMFYVYVLENEDKTWYIGYTTDLRMRLESHKRGQGCRTTNLKKRWSLINYEAYISKNDALGREKFLKSGSGHRFLRKQLLHYLNAIDS